MGQGQRKPIPQLKCSWLGGGGETVAWFILFPTDILLDLVNFIGSFLSCTSIFCIVFGTALADGQYFYSICIFLRQITGSFGLKAPSLPFFRGLKNPVSPVTQWSKTCQAPVPENQTQSMLLWYSRAPSGRTQSFKASSVVFLIYRWGSGPFLSYSSGL